MYTRVQLNPIYEREWKGCCWRIFDQIKETTNHASGEISVEDFFKLYLEKVFPLNLELAGQLSFRRIHYQVYNFCHFILHI